MINRSTFMISASAILCVCCGLSFADPATDSQDGKEILKEVQIQHDEIALGQRVRRRGYVSPKAGYGANNSRVGTNPAAKDDQQEETKKDEKDAKEEEAKEEAASPFTDPQEAIAFEEFNKFRVRHGLKPCEFNQNLQNIAKNHSNNMYRYRRMYHSGTRGVAENVFMGSSSGAFAIRVWSNSPGHRANMLGRYSRVGIARTGGYYTMVLQ